MQQLEEQEFKQMSKHKDEIDLTIVFNYLTRFFKKIGDKIAFTIHAAKANMLVMLLFLVVGAGVGYLLYYVTKPYYTSSMTLVLSEIRNEFVEDQLLKLSGMIEDNNFEEVATRLDVSVVTASQIKNMKFTNLDQERISEDSILTGSPFKIELSLYDNEAFTSMEPAIANYLENNRYFSKQKRIKQRRVESMISKLKNEITSLDSIKMTVTSPRGPVNGFVYGEPIDPTNLYREGISMYKEQIQMEAELERLDNIQVVNGFSPRLKPTGPNKLKYLFIGAAAFFFIGLMYVVRKENALQRRLI
ncbi:hypothetical protein ABID22_003766 [Pontibacter aydingkolensis]|uniref:Chain length determinant protein n=1 Tax=Pontibacter aydingkolensis TaxID=1911536 RepID=A0ABS7CYZ1_9BACT|nr:chain length determinant protein [Pontibacter aydingkolensis]MBW7469040.1 chain length determinant protein [Pontibacter aydingkolensis]